ncbi:hypothetical protein LV84_02280 [Algoriphagus ratkowskyi]|uniref:Uncharacterized protein n=1 Tax=Algoriphagus ratkowskyi TaxID=57028 RepID=A0A2W7R521_9BACT|nr:hypothetical protein [Algoriphagus ratkowskyi]PZX55918.1 hypothetical protein LV84_02280 [Algoriphagus ratkowskyi]TXD77262.1 hypothetical protein ESW18_13295 [Algoriphagus ratkowskyi]
MNLTEQQIIDINDGHVGRARMVIAFQESRGKLHHIVNDQHDVYLLNGITKEDLKYNPSWF